MAMFDLTHPTTRDCGWPPISPKWGHSWTGGPQSLLIESSPLLLVGKCRQEVEDD